MDDSNKPIDIHDPAFLDKYTEILNSIESGYLGVAREDHSLSDAQVDMAIEHLVRHYQSVAAGRTPRPIRLGRRSQTILEHMMSIAEILLGHPSAATNVGPSAMVIVQEPLTYAELVACLKRIRVSIRFWSKRGGRRGYLDYVLSFQKNGT